LIKDLLYIMQSIEEGGDESKGGWAQCDDRGFLSTRQEDP